MLLCRLDNADHGLHLPTSQSSWLVSHGFGQQMEDHSTLECLPPLPDLASQMSARPAAHNPRDSFLLFDEDD